MKTRILTLLSLVAIAFAGSLIAEESKDDAVDFKKIKCVVSGKPVNPEATAAYKEALIYFCCPGCPTAFQEDAKKFATKANHQLVATRQAKQKGCPMSGKEVAEGTQVEVDGVKVGFCCDNCKAAAEKKEGADQIELIFNDKSFEKAFEIAKQDDDNKDADKK